MTTHSSLGGGGRWRAESEPTLLLRLAGRSSNENAVLADRHTKKSS